MQTLFHENPYRQRIANGHSCMVRVHTKPEYQMMTPDIPYSQCLELVEDVCSNNLLDRWCRYKSRLVLILAGALFYATVTFVFF
jgi:hypothetical protein